MVPVPKHPKASKHLKQHVFEIDLTGETREKSASTYGIGLGGNFNRDTTYEISVGVPSVDDSNPTKTGPDHSILKFNLGVRF